MSIPKGVAYFWTGRGFGDHLIFSHVVKILNDNGINAVLFSNKLKNLVDVPFYEPAIHRNYEIVYTYLPNLKEPMLLTHLKNAEKMFKKKISFQREKHNFTPVIFKDEPTTPSRDVVLCTRTGSWTPYKNWPYFNELKKELEALKISYIDLGSADGQRIITNQECLNCVKKCKVYVGLETGVSHYVSKFANFKGLIIQSGYTSFKYWAFPYEYDAITADIECDLKPCNLNYQDILEGNGCPSNQLCMSKISVKTVLDKILQYI